MFSEIKVHEFSNGVKIVNTTPHKCTFEDNGNLVAVDPCGFVLNAEIVNEVAQVGRLQTVKVEFVTPRFLKDVAGLQFLNWVLNKHSDVLVVGSVIATLAYAGQVVGMVPCEGFERVPPASKRMRTDAFTLF